MIQTDENALICDLAETYHIYDYKKLPACAVASFAAGLRTDSRIVMKLGGLKVSAEIMLLASIVDRLSLLLWAQTKDGSKNRNRPKSLVNELVDDTRDEIEVCLSGEDFIKAREKLLRR